MPTSTTSPTPRPFRDTHEALVIRHALKCLPLDSAARATGLAALERVGEHQDRKTKIIGLVQEALSQLRLDIKYLGFDLEATRRERDEYKKRLGE